MNSKKAQEVFKELKLDPANNHCFECDAGNPAWASVTYGIFVCLECAYYHRRLGTHLSILRSIHMDSWNDQQLALMKVGGNTKARNFFVKNGLAPAYERQMAIESIYQTRTAAEYRENLRAESEGKEVDWGPETDLTIQFDQVSLLEKYGPPESMAQARAFPESFFCPITCELMKDPVVDPEGNSYERSAIEGWLRQDPTSPITRAPLTIAQLIPNRALKDAIAEKVKEHGVPPPAKPQVAAPAPAQSAPAPATSSPAPASSSPAPTTLSPTPSTSSPTVPAVTVATDGDVSLYVTSSKARDEILVHASVKPVPGTVRTPVDVCCVVDISGSMGNEASIKTGAGDKESHGLSLLDVVKHAVKTVVESLDEQDRFSLITFSTTAEIVFGLTQINTLNKRKINERVEKLEPDDTTNLWDGLRMGLDLLSKGGLNAGRASALLLLTDGQPNISPPRGELAMLKKYKAENKHLNTTVHTFGFGYQIDTKLLVSLAVEGHGMHSFIPDASFVGTAFVNAISNLLVTMSKNVTLNIEPLQGAKLVEILGGHPTLPSAVGTQIDLCSLHYGQSKDVVLRFSVPSANTTAGPQSAEQTPFVRLTARFNRILPDGNNQHELNVWGSSKNDGGVDLEVQFLRLSFVSAGNLILEQARGNQMKQASSTLAEIEELVKKCDDPRAKALLQDITGQVREAIIKTPENYFDKWGKHYLPSLTRAHLLQECNNFKDPGIQVYGGDTFQKIREVIDTIFVALPPPKPSVRRSAPPTSSTKHSSNYAAARAAPLSMFTYHNAAGPCFSGEGMVLLADGIEKKVQDIKRGDRVATSKSGDSAEILCVVKTHCLDGKEDLVTLPSGLRVTPYHPVKNEEGSWKFPIDLAPLAYRVECEAVYSFLLKNEGRPSMVIQGTECITLAHEIEGDKVASHPFYGTKRIEEDLRKMRGWEKGIVDLFPALCEGKCMVRDSESGLACGFARGADGFVAREM